MILSNGRVSYRFWRDLVSLVCGSDGYAVCYPIKNGGACKWSPNTMDFSSKRFEAREPVGD
ncbi:hypothetical protein QJS10_CPB21g01361 [Acorus calamus]|uniref:Uncharacterized protein n=1 Tax=Acorus calamus TaxID=4465 RepID=A0AAV9C5P7_ACOCL|nr:hypothetical protein QJS10_CPB21g01361 [Acorus calamus]